MPRISNTGWMSCDILRGPCAAAGLCHRFELVHIDLRHISAEPDEIAVALRCRSGRREQLFILCLEHLRLEARIIYGRVLQHLVAFRYLCVCRFDTCVKFAYALLRRNEFRSRYLRRKGTHYGNSLHLVDRSESDVSDVALSQCLVFLFSHAVEVEIESVFSEFFKFCR